jgi:predicted TIM-barrel fold metal-dependent hydrolase
MKLDQLVAIDVHTHAEVSCRQEPDEAWQPFEAASAKYFKAGKRPTIPETIAYYRERKIGLVMFTVDSEYQIGAKRIPNEEVADAARENSDMMIAFASIDPHKGKMGVREARRLIADGVIRGFKFHPTLRAFFRTIGSPINCTKSSPSTSYRRSSIAAILEWVQGCQEVADCV